MGTSRVDSEKRIALPGANPGEVFDIREQGEGRFLLVRIEKQQSGRRMSEAACMEAMDKAPLRPTLEWDELRELTREP